MRDELGPGGSGSLPGKPSPHDVERRRSVAPSGTDEESPLGDDLRFYWDVLRRRWRLVAGVVLVLLLGTAVGTALTPPTYRASGLLEIRSGDADMERRENFFGEQDVTDEYLQTQYGILESQAVARKVVESLRLDTVEAFASESSKSSEDDGARPLQALVEEVQSDLDVDPLEESRLVRVRYETGDPELSAAIVNAALNGYVDVRVQAGRDVASWLARQVDSTKAELRESERALLAYARDHDLPVVDGAGGETETVLDGRLRELEAELTRARTDRIRAESRYRQVTGTGGVESLDNRVIQDLVVELAALRKEYARLTTVFQEGYPKAREVRRQIEELEAELAQEKARVADQLESDYRVARRRETLLQDAVDQQRELGRRMADESGRYRLLQREVESTRNLLATFQETRKEAEVSATLREARFGIVDLAVPPRSPVGAGLKQNLALALVAGLMLGFGAAFVRERFEGPIRTASGGASELGPPPLLELISKSEDDGSLSPGATDDHEVRRIPPGPRRDSGDGPIGRPGAAERDAFAGSVGEQAASYHALRAELFPDGAQGAPTSILVTSCQPREGATTVAVNLARSAASAGRRTLLVDADLRRPSFDRPYIEGTPGLWEHLTGGEPWRSVVQGREVEGLDVLPAGCVDGDVGAALASARMQTFLSEAEEAYDCVILDSAALFVDPPDARILFSLVDGVLVVLRSGRTPRALVRRVLDRAPRAWGVVVGGSGEGDLVPSRVAGIGAMNLGRAGAGGVSSAADGSPRERRAGT